MMTEIQEKDCTFLPENSSLIPALSAEVKYRMTHEGSPYSSPGSVVFTFKPKSETCV